MGSYQYVIAACMWSLLLPCGCAANLPTASATAMGPSTGFEAPLSELRAAVKTNYPDPVFGGTYALLSLGPTRRDDLSQSKKLPPPWARQSTTNELASVAPPPLLLVHGIAERGMVDFFPLLPRLAVNRTVLAVDLPGFGKSTGGNKIFSPERYARFLAHVIEQHAPGGVVDVVGHSLGATVAISLAAKYPSKVRRLVTLAAAGILYHQTLLYEMNTTHNDVPEVNLFRLLERELWKAGLSLIGALSSKPSQVVNDRTLRKKVLQGDPTQIASLALLGHNYDADLSAVQAPTLLLWGQHDETSPARTFHVLRERLPVWESHVLDGVGHNLMNEAPGRLWPLLQTFLDSSHLGKFEATRPPFGPSRNGVCHSRRAALFEGHYHRIEIHGCAEVLIRNAVVGSLVAENSNVELRHVTVEDGTRLVGSNLRATGSLLLGDTALLVDASTVDLAGVEVVGTRAALAAESRAKIIGSISGFTGPRGREVVHGKREVASGGRL